MPPEPAHHTILRALDRAQAKWAALIRRMPGRPLTARPWWTGSWPAGRTWTRRTGDAARLRDPVEGIFEIRGNDGDVIILLNLIDDLEYRTYPNMGRRRRPR